MNNPTHTQPRKALYIRIIVTTRGLWINKWVEQD